MLKEAGIWGWGVDSPWSVGPQYRRVDCISQYQQVHPSPPSDACSQRHV